MRPAGHGKRVVPRVSWILHREVAPSKSAGEVEDHSGSHFGSHYGSHKLVCGNLQLSHHLPTIGTRTSLNEIERRSDVATYYFIEIVVTKVHTRMHEGLFVSSIVFEWAL